MLILSKAQEISQLRAQKEAKLISKKEFQQKVSNILSQQYTQYDNGIDPLQEIELLRGLLSAKVISRKNFNAQQKKLATLNIPSVNTTPTPNTESQPAQSEPTPSQPGGYNVSQNQVVKVKKPIYKRPWFYILIVVVIIIIAAVTTNANKPAENALTEEPATTETESVKYTDEDFAKNPNLVVYDNFGEYYTAMTAACDALDEAIPAMLADDTKPQSESTITAEDAQTVVDAAQAVQNIGYDSASESGLVLSDTMLHMSAVLYQSAAQKIIDAGGAASMTEEQIEQFNDLLLKATTGLTEGEGWVAAREALIREGEEHGMGSAPEENATPNDEAQSEPAATSETPDDSSDNDSPEETRSQSNAVQKAKDYLSFTAFSRKGLIEQLEYEGFSSEDAEYGVDNSGADWNEQAAKKAEEYLDTTAFSRDGLIEQLEFEGFTNEQAVYGVDATGL